MYNTTLYIITERFALRARLLYDYIDQLLQQAQYWREDDRFRLVRRWLFAGSPRAYGLCAFVDR